MGTVGFFLKFTCNCCKCLNVYFEFDLYSDDDLPDQKSKGDNSIQGSYVGSNPFLDTPQNAAAIEYKKGYVMRKCCFDSNYKKSESLIYHSNHQIHTQTQKHFKSSNCVRAKCYTSALRCCQIENHKTLCYLFVINASLINSVLC